MNIIACVAIALLLIGFWMMMFSPETSRKRYLGWLITAITITVYTIIRLAAGDLTAGALMWNIGIGLFDYFLAYYWYARYKEAKNEKEFKRLNNREKFLREIKSKKW